MNMTPAEFLYLAHTVLELILGMLKLRGRYAHEAGRAVRPERDRMYVRHHGFSLLALAQLGGIVWWRSATATELGAVASIVLATFHGGAVLAFAYTFSLGAVDLKKVFIPHAPFAVAFALHVNGHL